MRILNHQKNALIFQDREISYEELLKRIAYLSKILDIDKDEKVAIFMENRPEWIYSFFSIWRRDATCILIDVFSSAEDLAYILKDCEPAKIFVSNQSREVAEEAVKASLCKIDMVNVDDLDSHNCTKEEVVELDFLRKNKDDLAVIIYTSGTTGNPRGVMLSYGNLRSNLEDVLSLGIIQKKDVMLSILQFHHSYPLMALVLAPLSKGCTNVIVDSIGTEEIFRCLSTYKVSIIIGVPRLYSLLARGILKHLSSGFASKLYSLMKRINIRFLRKLVFNKIQKKFGGNIKYFISGGARLDVEVAEALQVLGFTVLEGYGLTETSPIISFNTNKNNRIGTVGHALSGIEVKLVDNEILVKGPSVMLGYYKKESDTKSVIKNGWFHTGDLGSITDGYITITGRKKEMIVLSNGKNIFPDSIEDKILLTSKYIKEVGCFQEQDSLALIVYPDFDLLANDKILNIDETIKWQIMDNYNPTAPDYRRIYNYYIVDKELPKTRLGKLRRFMLPSLARKREEEFTGVEPTSETYVILKNYLAEISKRDVNPDKHIELDLGLDSIDKVDLQYFLEKVFGINLNSEALANYMVVRDLFEYVEESKAYIRKELIGKHVNESTDEEVEINLNSTGKLMRLAQMLVKPTFKLYFKLEVKGLEKLPNRNFIMAPNHQSFIDPQILASALPYEIIKNTYSLAFYSHFQSKIMQFLGRNTNVITINIDKNLKEVLLKLESVLRKDKNLLIFPEGAITRTGNLMAFKPTFAMLSKRTEVPIVPIVIKGATEAMPWGTKIPRPKKIEVIFLDPIYPGEDSYEVLSQKVYNVIEKELKVKTVKEKKLGETK